MGLQPMTGAMEEKKRSDLCGAESMTVKVGGYRQTHICSLLRGHRGKHYCGIHGVSWGFAEPPEPVPPEEWFPPTGGSSSAAVNRRPEKRVDEASILAGGPAVQA
jgi:hypothetical protein